MIRASVIAVLAALLASALLQAAIPAKVPRLGAVASQNRQCTDIGTQMLTKGGNAVDALIATQICIGTIAMSHAGIGGGGFMVLRQSDGSYETIDYQVRAPAAAHEGMFGDDESANLIGGLASAVPGELRGLEYIHRYAKLAWAELLEPSIRLAEEGFEVSADLLTYIRGVRPKNRFIVDPNDSWAADFVIWDATLGKKRRVRVGDVMTRKRYAETLRRIAANGAGAFYEGEMAEATIRSLQNSKYNKNSTGVMTLDDLRGYTIRRRKPVSVMYRGHKVVSTGAPSSGAVTLGALNVLGGYDGLGDPAQANLSTHRIDEVFRWMFAQRSFLGDPDHVDGVDVHAEAMMASGPMIRSRIRDDATFPAEHYDPSNLEPIDTPGTAHIVAADYSGMAVSSTTTIGHWFGCHVMVEETGVVMNSQMSVFSKPGVTIAGPSPNPNNLVGGGKRPLSAISPVIIESPDGQLFAATGAAGKNRIITTVVQNVVHLIDGGMTAAEALVQPRMHDQLNAENDRIQFEWHNPLYPFATGNDNGTVEYMRALGHNISWVRPGLSSAQSLRRLPNGTFEAAGEPRQWASGGLAV